jgi:hypothetical protein
VTLNRLINASRIASKELVGNSAVLSNIFEAAVWTATVSAPRFAFGTSFPRLSPLFETEYCLEATTAETLITRSAFWSVSRMIDQPDWLKVGPKAMPRFKRARRQSRFLVLKDARIASNEALGVSRGEPGVFSGPRVVVSGISE